MVKYPNDSMTQQTPLVPAKNNNLSFDWPQRRSQSVPRHSEQQQQEPEDADKDESSIPLSPQKLPWPPSPAVQIPAVRAPDKQLSYPNEYGITGNPGQPRFNTFNTMATMGAMGIRGMGQGHQNQSRGSYQNNYMTADNLTASPMTDSFMTSQQQQMYLRHPQLTNVCYPHTRQNCQDFCLKLDEDPCQLVKLVRQIWKGPPNCRIKKKRKQSCWSTPCPAPVTSPGQSSFPCPCTPRPRRCRPRPRRRVICMTNDDLGQASLPSTGQDFYVLVDEDPMYCVPLAPPQPPPQPTPHYHPQLQPQPQNWGQLAMGPSSSFGHGRRVETKSQCKILQQSKTNCGTTATQTSPDVGSVDSNGSETGFYCGCYNDNFEEAKETCSNHQNLHDCSRRRSSIFWNGY